MRNNMEYDEQLLHALSELPPSDESEQVPDVVNERICRLALQKIQLAAEQTVVLSEQGFESKDNGRDMIMQKTQSERKVGLYHQSYTAHQPDCGSNPLWQCGDGVCGRSAAGHDAGRKDRVL